MSITCVICEYNPLHSGHKYHIDSMKKCPDDAVVAIMSSNFVQRGIPAIFDKYTRAQAAIIAGCDLVLELPAPYSFGGAEYFARAGVYIADAVGVCDRLSFGSEAGDIEKLRDACAKLASSDFLQKVKSSGHSVGHQYARYDAANKLYGEDFAKMISSSNNILALEYIKSAELLNCELELVTIARVGDGYNDRVAKSEYVSATFLRELIERGENITEYIPEAVARCGVYSAPRATLENISMAILSFFRLSPPEKLEVFAEAGGGLAHRLCRSAHKAISLDEFFALAQTKKYTNARIRRAVLSCMLGIREADFKAPPEYTRVLAANDRGRSILRKMKKTSKIEIIVRSLPKMSPRGAEIALRADALYSLAREVPQPSNTYVKKSPYIG